MSSIHTISAIVFFVCLAGVTFAYLGYPVLIWLLARCFGHAQNHSCRDESELPVISVLIAAHDEEAMIEERILNALASDYPAGRLEIVIASDGSTDRTAEIVRRYADRGVRLLDYHQRRGKPAVLNSAFAELNGDIVMLSDANTFTEPSALRKLVRWFSDPEVGVVCGRLVLTDPATGRNADSLYWRYETFLKKCEGRLGALLGANGAIYAIRRELFVPIPAETIIDDFVIPLMARLRTGCTIVYDADAVANEETPPLVRSEFQRRARIGAGGYQSLGTLWKLLDPRAGWVAFTFASHKILRWLCPFLLMGALASNLVLWIRPFFQEALLCQFAFYTLAVLTAYMPAERKSLKPLRLTTMFAMMNLALLLGFWRWLSGSQNSAWRRTVRLAELAEAEGAA